MNQICVSEAERVLGLHPGQFPFKSRYASVEGCRVHYVDEGKGPLLLMIHGNPTWSIVYARLIADLKGAFRCVALDLPGFGLSSAPAGYSFKPEEHARVAAAFIENLDLTHATLIGHDWGGPVGLGAMAATEGRITRLCLGNTWAWPVNGDFHFEWFSKLLGGPIGRFAAHRYAVFINLLMPSTMMRRKLSADEMNAYRAPFQDRAARRPMHVFPASITGSGAWLSTLETAVSRFKGPAHFIWPENDIAFRDKELARWQRLLPQAGVTRLPKCGHYLWLDAPGECAAAVRGFMSGQ
jgi:haloalkane dehalogenase